MLRPGRFPLDTADTRQLMHSSSDQLDKFLNNCNVINKSVHFKIYFNIPRLHCPTLIAPIVAVVKPAGQGSHEG